VKVLVTGANGQLGSDLCKALHEVEVVPLTHADIEITDMDSVKSNVAQHCPDVIINTAAYVRVDDCEIERDRAFAVNALGARNLAVAAQETGCKIVQISTDYVFGGGRPPESGNYTEFDHPAPINIYGISKLAGEDIVRSLCLKHFIVRTCGLFGVAGSSGKGGNFVETILKLASKNDEIKVVSDQILSPSYTLDVADKIAKLITTEYYGIFHIVNSGACSWFEFAEQIVKMKRLKTQVLPISSDQYPQKAKRPQFSALDSYHLKLLGMGQMRSWQEALKAYMISKGHFK
jgi:dTDP-4-dehydrorhamnose reductase